MTYTHDRSDRIPLAPAEPRCEPATCTVRARCARFQADIKRGSPVDDFSIEPLHGGTATCNHFLDSGAVRAAASNKPPPIARRAIGSEL